jgi:tetratricopeptide (TPR) repeat protein
VPPPSAPAAEQEASDSDADETFHDARFPPDEEASLVAASNTTKAEANRLFAQARYSEAISTYDRALGSCPNYLDYEIAVLKSNISACHLKLEEWKQAVDAANTALEALDKIDPPPSPPSKKEKEKTKEGDGQASHLDSDDVVVELAGGGGDDDDDDSAALAKLVADDTRKADISRIRAKALMRRARARASLSGWANLAGAEEDYKRLASDPRLSSILPPSDMRTVRAGLRDLPPKTAAAKDKEMAEMMGKLKELGNGILKPFGLSTDNFKMVKDDKTGGYSVNFEQGGNKQ